MASEDRILKILLQIQSDLSGLAPVKSGMADIRKETEDTAKSAFGLKQAFEFAGANQAFEEMVNIIREVPRQLEEWIKGGIEFSAQIQNIQTGIAAVLQLTQGGKFANFDEAKIAAGEFIDTMKEKANELGVEYIAMFESVQHTQAQLANAGVNDVNKAIDLTVALNRAMQSVGVSAVQAARDIGDILQGQAARTLGGGRLAPALGFTKEEMDQWILGLIQTGQLYDGLMSKLAPFQSAAIAAAANFDASLNRVKNSILDLGGEAAKPIMGPLQEAFERFAATAKSDDIKALARVFGDIGAVVTGMARGLGEATLSLGGFVEKYRQLINLTPLGNVATLLVGDVKGSFDNNLLLVKTEELRKQYDLIHQQTLEADTAAKKTEAFNALNAQEINVLEQIAAEKAKGAQADDHILEALQKAYENLRSMQAIFPDIAGTAEQAATATREISAALQKVLDAQALLHAETYGSDADIYKAKWIATYHSIADEAKKVGDQNALSNLDQLTYEKLRGPERARELADAEKESGVQRDITAFLREDSLLMTQIHNAQQLISANPFLSADQKQAQSVPLIISEISQLNAEIQRGQVLMHGGSLDPAQYDQVGKAVDNLKTKVQLLKFQLQESSFSGGLIADLTKWTNSFGTAAQQIGHTIQGTINASLQQFNQLLLTGKFNAQQLLQQIAQLGLTLIEQMLLQRAMQAINHGQSVQLAATTGPMIASLMMPAATVVSIATEGEADVQAPIAIAAAIAASSGLAFAAEGGLISRPTMTMMGEEGPEFVFSAPAVRNIGAQNLEAAHQSARSISSGQSATSTSSQGGGSGGHHINIALVDETKHAEKWLNTRAGQNHIIKIVQGGKLQLGVP
jgi:soluble cytochrome b562